MQTEPKQTDILTLAFLGDAVYELAVRERIAASGAVSRADALHKKAVAYVNASSQAFVIKQMMDEGFLTDEEADLARRAHNHRIATKPKNADPVTYKWATAFEALLGYLKLSGGLERLARVMDRAFEITEGRMRQKAAEDTDA